MADKAPPANQPDLTPIFILLLIIIIAGLGSVRACGPSAPNAGCTAQPPTQTPPPEPNPRPGPPITTELNQYTVQAGAFKTKVEAVNLAAELRNKNINNFILEADGQWLVCVGKFVSADRANRMVATLKAYGVSEPVVLPPKKK
jgi:cell division septation protein DedD